MGAIGDLNIRIDAIISPLLKSLATTERKLKASAAQFRTMGNDLTLSLSAPLALIGGAAIRAAGDLEQMKNGLTSMMGGAAAASEELKKLQEIAKLPGINMTQAIQGDQRLQSAGMSAEQARKSMVAFSNAMFLAGKSSQNLDNVTLALSQIASKPKIVQQDLNQIFEQVPQVAKIMRELWGTMSGEELTKMGVTTSEFVTKVTDKLMELPKATGGINNALDNAAQAMTLTLAALGEDLNKTFDIEGLVSGFSTVVGVMVDQFKSLSFPVKFVAYSMSLIALTAGPMLKLVSIFQSLKAVAVGLYADGIQKIKAGLAITTPQIAALALVIGGLVLAYNKISAGIERANFATNTFAEVTLEANKAAAEQTTELEYLKKKINDTATSNDEYRKAVLRIRELDPANAAAYSLERSALTTNNALLGKKIELIKSEVMLTALKNKAVELATKQEDLKAKIEEKSKATAFRTLGVGGMLEWIAGTDAATAKADLESVTTALDGLLGRIDELQNKRLGTKTPVPGAPTATGGGSGSGGTKPVAIHNLGPETAATSLFGPDGEIEQRLAVAVDAIQTYRGELVQVVSAKEDLIKVDGLLINAESEATANAIKNAEALRQKYEELQNFSSAAQNAVAGIADQLYQTALTTGAGFKEMATQAVGAIAKVIKALIMQATAAAVARSIVESGGNVFVGLAVGAIAGAAVGTLLNELFNAVGIPALAKGGLVTSPTMALVGDNPGARHDPELITPVSKLPGMLKGLGMGGGNVNVQGAFTGSDFRLMTEREARNRGRIRGF